MSTNQKKGNRSAIDTGDEGLALVREQLERRGAFVRKEEGQMNLLYALSADCTNKYTIRTRTKGPASNNWQVQTTDGKKPEESVDEKEFWVLVDLQELDKPMFYVVPGTYLRRKIYEEFNSYLKKHGGERPVTPGSTHHALSPDSISTYENRWDLLNF